MGSFSIWHWLVVLAVVLLLFGGSGKISSLMGDLAKGIKSFKKNMSEESDASMEAQATTPAAPSQPAGTIAGPSASAAAGAGAAQSAQPSSGTSRPAA
ncbi:twin-arginine translocase TatA/TatE family subunit [Caldovatus sediminis]|jgi:sec-independent protein translocase protein TatA|nr:twin-arginine translocase TatA/TatE family subunit [Caldovatus sediminis]